MRPASKPAPADTEDEILKLRAELTEMADELGCLRAAAAGNHDAAVYRMYAKIQRQRAALNRLTVAQTRLHFALRLMNQLRDPVTAAEWNNARTGLGDDRLRDRVGKEVPVPA